MIDFMVIAGPRSGTTWVSNWLTNGSTFCYHDPLEYVAPENIDQLTIPGRTTGVSCTALGLFPDVVNAHPARKVILHRPTDEIHQSLKDLGVTDHTDWNRILYKIEGWHMPWTHIFDTPDKLYMYLTHQEFDPLRHELLVKMKIEMSFSHMKAENPVLVELIDRLKGGVK